MIQVSNDADVFDIHIANLLLFVEINYPEYIVIGQPIYSYPGKHPLFRAMLTTKGKDFLIKRLK